MTIERPLKIAGRIAVRELLSLAHSQQMTKRIPLVYSMSGRNSRSSGSWGSAQARYSAISLKRLLGRPSILATPNRSSPSYNRENRNQRRTLCYTKARSGEVRMWGSEFTYTHITSLLAPPVLRLFVLSLQRTHCWRELDSNPRSPRKGQHFLRPPWNRATTNRPLARAGF